MCKKDKTQVKQTYEVFSKQIRVITKLPNTEQSSKGKGKTHKSTNRQSSQQPENCENRNDPDLVQAFLKKWWVESDFKAPLRHRIWYCFDNYFTYFVPVFKYCFSDNRNL
jgi:hypothetical protein